MHVFQEHGGLYAYMISSQCIIIALVYGYLRMELKKRSTTLHCTIALHSRFLSHALLWLKILHPTGEMRFWGGRFERTYFDVRVFNPHAKSHRQSSLYRPVIVSIKNELMNSVSKKLSTPLSLFSTTGGMANEATAFYKRLASCLATKWDQSYSSTMSWLRCRLTFSLLRSAIQCIHGAK